MNNRIIKIISIAYLIFLSSASSAQILEIKGGLDDKSVSIQTQNGIPSSRVIIQSNLSLTYTTNMEDIPNENIRSAIINELNIDTIYFYLDSLDNHRRLFVHCQGYAVEKIDLILNSKITYSYIVFDPYIRDYNSSATNNLSNTRSEYIKIKDEVLPNWIFEAQGNGRYVGVSDPALEKNKAFNQALLRAWMLSQVDTQFQIEDKSEMWESNEQYEYESKSRLSSLRLKDITLYIGREYISNYGEYFVEFFTEPTNDNRIYTFSINKDCKGFEFTQYTQGNKDKSSISINGVIDFPNYDNNYFSKTEVFSNQSNNKSNLDTPQFKYKSTLPDAPKHKTEKPIVIDDVMSSDGTKILRSSSLNEGYWYAFISSLIDDATSLSGAHNCEIYSTGNWEKNEMLSSMINNNIMRISTSEIHIRENELYIEWNINIIGLQKDIIINGRVIDNKNKPVAGATITIPGETNSTVTDINGLYSLSVKADKIINLIVQSQKYTSARKQIAVEDNKHTYTIDFIINKR